MASSYRSTHNTRQGPHGLSALDVNDLLAPMVSGLFDVQKAIIEEKNQDPVPGYSNEQIGQTTTFLRSALQGMQSYLDTFTETSLEFMDDRTLKQQLCVTRKSAKQLMLMLGDRSTEFKGSKTNMSMVAFKRGNQDREMRDKLVNLQSLLKAFGPYLASTMTSGSEGKIELAVALLDGLLDPPKFKPPRESVPQHLMQRQRQSSQRTQQDEHPNPLEGIGAGQSNDKGTSSLERLTAMSEKLTALLKCDQEQWQAVRSKLETKMVSLKKLAEVLSQIPDVLNKYMLVCCDGSKGIPCVEVSGIAGRYAKLNGKYIQTGDFFNNQPSYRKQDNPKKWFCFSGEDWIFQNSNDKGCNTGFIYRRGVELSSSCRPWIVSDGEGRWEQQVSVSVNEVKCSMDNKQLKRWISEEEADSVHEMLDSFRDALTKELAVREATRRLGTATSLNSSQSSLPDADEYQIITEHFHGARASMHR